MKKLLLATTALTALAAAPAYAGPVTAAVSWIGSTLAAGGIGAALLRTAIGIGASLLGQALTPQPDQPELSVKFDVQWGDDNPLSFIAGDYVTAGKRKYIGSWGKDTRFITDVIEISALPQPGLVGMWVDDAAGDVLWNRESAVSSPSASTAQEYDAGTVPAGMLPLGHPLNNYRDDADTTDPRIWVRFIDGTQTAADDALVSFFGSDPDYPWTADMVGTGKSYVIITTQYDDDTLTSYPAYLFQPDALPMYDIRKDDTAGGIGAHRWGQPETYEPSRNPAVIAYNIIRGIHFGSEWVWGGKNLATWRLPAAEWMAAANACDDPVTLAGGGTEPAYRCGMEIEVSMTPASVLEEIGKAANMHFAEVGGMIKPIVGLPGAAAMAITDDSIIITEGQSLKPFNPVSDTFNALSATYPEPGEKWTTKDSPEFIDTEATTADGGRHLPTSVSYPAAPYGKQVQRLQRAQMQDFRRFRRHQFHLPPEAYALEPGVDMISWTSNRNGYENKLFVVESVAKTPGMNVLVSLREVDPGDYDWSSGFEMPTDIATPVNPAPFTQPITGLTVLPATVKDGDSTDRRPAIRVACDENVPGATHIQIQARVQGETDIVIDTNRGFVDPHIWFLVNVLPFETYEVRARLLSDRTPKSVWSPWLTVTTPEVLLQWADLADNIKQAVEDAQAEADQAAADATAASAKADQVQANLDTEVAQLYVDLEAGLDGVEGQIVQFQSAYGSMNHKTGFMDEDMGGWQTSNTNTGEPGTTTADIVSTTGAPDGFTSSLRIGFNDIGRVLIESPARIGDTRGRTIRVRGLGRGVNGGSLYVGIRAFNAETSTLVRNDWQQALIGDSWQYFDTTFTIPSGAAAATHWAPLLHTSAAQGTTAYAHVAWVEITDVTDAVAAQASATSAMAAATNAQQSIANITNTVEAEFQDWQAFVDAGQTALATAGLAQSAYTIRAVAGAGEAGLRIVAWDDESGSGGVVKVFGDYTIAEGTLGAYALTIFDPANLVPDNQFQSEAAWDLPSGPFVLSNSGAIFSSIGMLRYNHAGGTGFTSFVSSRRFSVDNSKPYYFALRAQSGGNYTINVRVQWFDESGAAIAGQNHITNDVTDTGVTDYNATFTAPGNAQQARIHIRVDRDKTDNNINIGDLVARAKNPGSTLITPNSITSDLVTTGELITLSAQIANGIIGSAKIANAAIDTAHIKNLSVGTIKIADGAVTRQYSNNNTGSGSVSVTFPTQNGSTVVIWGFANNGTSNVLKLRISVNGTQAKEANLQPSASATLIHITSGTGNNMTAEVHSQFSSDLDKAAIVVSEFKK
ncbi:hypothetical protein [Paracoccus methylarcula]|uniref:Tip attachment protein J domain-containing protein n=1 Tax=Paracoccus methylarcula TaxID=72022 RepID=A0A422QZI0_9RHOB|nr:hypothetical protein [Paracoccus methylarcula]RNF35384.1 hypothetical protein A7A09_007300 [Paracoccus methylarcula]